jgi:hypothetical protein
MKLPGYDPFANDGANYNMLMGGKGLDRVSGTAPHRSLSCNIVPVNPRPNRMRGWRGFRKMEVVRTQRVADEVTAVWLRAQDPLPDYQPGQHITLPIGAARPVSGRSAGSQHYFTKNTRQCYNKNS